MACDETSEEEWVYIRFTEHCYFFPTRDCPGWEFGKKCGRFDMIISEDEMPDELKDYKFGHLLPKEGETDEPATSGGS